MQITAAEARVLAAIDEQWIVDALVAEVRVPSVTGTAAESELQHRQAAELAALGMDVDLWSIDVEQTRRHPDFPGDETDRTEAYGVVATTGQGEPALVLQHHVDVVPIGDPGKWEHAPFDARIGGTTGGDVLHGRGACDMKAGAVANMAAVRALLTSGVRLERPLAVHSVISEEDGGLGAFATLIRGHRGAAAVISEPTSGRLVTANAGALTFELRCPGRAAHGSTRLEGVNAFDAFLPVHRALAQLEAARNTAPDPRFADNPLPYPISIGRVRTGDWASSVPDLLIAEGRYGVRIGEDPADARREFEQAIAAVCAADPWLADHPVVISWPGGQFASGAIDDDHEFVRAVADAAADVSGGVRPPTAAAPYGSDLRLYTGLGGIPTLHWGPGDARFAHAPREQVQLDEVFMVARGLALLAVRSCSHPTS
ncbi:M20/M25/M40 family metallo-hydrolase [Nakamurella sp. YIM 132087]|uniref:M20/M25/M40 family metallo-hydrolase n=1 Tax=Nakamurella alba TaxID=2665158 RepID=A0A7K1FM84_9ACTN|nr:M20/M25/M40 family metallo-hydrolase [Nakamurella alba]MTD15265.1 M20/M25/M40 family metallo-hydrolase [Nakamurella alba]